MSGMNELKPAGLWLQTFLREHDSISITDLLKAATPLAPQKTTSWPYCSARAFESEKVNGSSGPNTGSDQTPGSPFDSRGLPRVRKVEDKAGVV